MKTRTISLLLVLSLAASVFYACKKDQEKDNTEVTQPKLTDADRAVAGRILEFRRKQELKKTNPTLKSSEIIKIDDARLDVETNFNASFAFPNEKYEKTRTERTLVYLTVVDDNFTTVDNMLALYNDCLNKVLELYNSSTLENKELLFINLKKDEIRGSQLLLRLNVVLGTKQQPGYSWEPFGEGDNWLYGDLFGKCNGTEAGSDAAEQIEEQINANRPIFWTPSPDYRFVYTIDINSPYKLQGNEFKNAAGDNLIFYIEKYTSLDDDDICLNVDEMNFHYNGQHEVIYDLVPALYSKPLNWEFMGCDIEGKYDNVQGKYKIHHKNNLNYAYRNLVKINEIAEPTPISTL